MNLSGCHEGLSHYECEPKLDRNISSNRSYKFKHLFGRRRVAKRLWRKKRSAHKSGVFKTPTSASARPARASLRKTVMAPGAPLLCDPYL